MPSSQSADEGGVAHALFLRPRRRPLGRAASGRWTMRIAQIAPAVEAVPPDRYGGTERVVAGLVEELVRRGHEVTLFASGDSETSARLVPVVPRGLRLAGVRDPMPAALLALGLAYDRA